MIKRYHLSQILLLCVHLIASLLGFKLSWTLLRQSLVPDLFAAFDFLLPFHWRGEDSPLQLYLCLLAILIGSYVAFRMWINEDTTFPGVLSAVPQFSNNPTTRSSSGEYALMDFYLWARILGNLFLFGPMQTLFAAQRVCNLIPFSHAAEAELVRLRATAEEQGKWHPFSTYHENEEEAKRLIRMGVLDYSPTKDLVRLRS